MRIDPRWRRCFLAGLLTLAPAGVTTASPALAREVQTREVWYSLTAKVRGAGPRADILAGGRLLMSVVTDRDGGGRLELVRPLEDPWKLYWVDPFGPLGEEIKLATVKILPEATWEALAAAQHEIGLAGHARHALWLQDAERKRALDGAFGFLVIGPARGRFAIDFETSGSVRNVTNHLTDRWLPGPFDRFVEAAPGATPHGYWFWNQGETEPFDYEPHTYHALAAALELLTLPLPEATVGTPIATWHNLRALASKVLATLAPKIGSRIRYDPPQQDAIRVEGRRDGRSLVMRVDRPEHGLTVERVTVYPNAHSTATPPASDRLRLALESRQRSLEIEVGYAASRARPLQ